MKPFISVCFEAWWVKVMPFHSIFDTPLLLDLLQFKQFVLTVNMKALIEAWPSSSPSCSIGLPFSSTMWTWFSLLCKTVQASQWNWAFSFRMFFCQDLGRNLNFEQKIKHHSWTPAVRREILYWMRSEFQIHSSGSLPLHLQTDL